MKSIKPLIVVLSLILSGFAYANSFEDAVRNAISSLESRVPSQFSIMNSTASGFDVITDGVGTLTVSIDNIRDYADGAEVTLELVNLTSVTLQNVVLNVGVSQGNKDEYLDKKNTYSEETVQEIKPGSATLLRVRISGWSPKDIKSISAYYQATRTISYRPAKD